MKCQKCGNFLEEGNRFCSKCGHFNRWQTSLNAYKVFAWLTFIFGIIVSFNIAEGINLYFFLFVYISSFISFFMYGIGEIIHLLRYNK